MAGLRDGAEARPQPVLQPLHPLPDGLGARQFRLAGHQGIGDEVLAAPLGRAVVTLLLTGLVGWQVAHPPERGDARALGAVDSTLVQT
jgi:hypothetical protein